MSLKIGVIFSGPLTTSCSLDPICPDRGYAIDTALIVCRNLHLNCSFFRVENEDFGDADESGIGSGMIGAIQSGQFDTGLPVFTPTFNRARAVDFSDAYFYDDIALVTRVPNMDHGKIHWGIVNVFQWPVWGVLIVVFLLLITIIAFFGQRLYSCIDNSNSESYRLPVDTIRGIGRLSFRESLTVFVSFRLIIAFWAMTYIILYSAYTGLLFSSKINRYDNLPFIDLETFAQCLEMGQCKVITPTISVSYLQILTSAADQVTNRIGKAIKNHGALIANNQDIPAAIQAEKSIYLVWIWNKVGAIYEIRGNDRCEFYVMDVPYKDINAFPVRKNSSLARLLSRQSWPFVENSLGKILQGKYLPPNMHDSVCDGGWKKWRSWLDDGNGLDAMSITFLVLGFGLGLAIGAILVEIVMEKMKWKFGRR